MAQELLSSHATAGSEVDIELIPRLVLCPGHAIGELPRMYAEKWADFSKQRLSKEEAMSKFNADFWMSIQFFSNEKRHDDTFRATSSNRPRTVSHLSSCSRNEYDFGSIERAGGTSRMPQVMPPWESATQNFEFVFLSRSPNSKTRAMPSRRDVLERPSSSGEFQLTITSHIINTLKTIQPFFLEPSASLSRCQSQCPLMRNRWARVLR